MANQLYLSYWLRGFTEHTMLQQFDSVLRRFPFSRLAAKAQLRVRAVDLAEPTLLEKEFSGGFDISSIVEAAQWFRNPDGAFEVETTWDLWDFEDDWALKPAPIVLSCYAPLFPSELGEQIRIELGLDSQFLPQREVSSTLAPVESNIRSLLHLVTDLDKALPVESRRLWSESGENLAQRLQEALAD